MKIIKKKSKLKELLCSLSKQKIGFVPTMGALHAGHISLIKASKSRCDLTICSIYVNPTQFNSQKDLRNYPTNRENDIELLEKHHCDILFIPNDFELYENNLKSSEFDLNNLDKFNVLDTPILAGFSRKSMIYKTLKTSNKKALNGTSSLNTIALMKGAKILRVHDVKEAKECIILHEKTISSLF